MRTMERSSGLDGGPALFAVDGWEIARADDVWPPRAPGRMIAVPAWRTRGEAMRAAGGFNRLVDQNAAWVPAETIDAYRAACDASPEDAQFEFLAVVAGHLTLRLAAGAPDPITRAAALLAEWFLRARGARAAEPSPGPVAASA